MVYSLLLVSCRFHGPRSSVVFMALDLACVPSFFEADNEKSHWNAITDNLQLTIYVNSAISYCIVH